MSGRRTGRIKLSYLLYAVLLTAVLLYVRFPSARVQEYLGGKIETAFSPAGIQAGTYRYVFPATLRFDKVVVSAGDGGDEIALVENLAVSPAIAGFGLKYSLAGELYGGTFQLGLKLSPLAGKCVVENMEMTKVDLRRSTFIQRVFQREIEGELDFNGTAAVGFDGESSGRLEGEAVVRGGEIPLRQPILLVTRMDFQELAAKLSYDGELLKLADGSLKGKQFNADYSGSLQTADNPESWQLELKGSLIPQQEYTGANPQVQRLVTRLQKQFRTNELPFMVNGSIINPRFRFGNQ